MKRGPDQVRALIYAGLEAGVNTYHVGGVDPQLVTILGEALSSVDRNLLFISLQTGVSRGRMGLTRDFSPEALTKAIDLALEASQIGYLDLVVLDDPGAEELPRAGLEFLKSQRTTGRVNLLGVAGDNQAMEAYMSTNAFDVLVTPYSLCSGSKERNRLRTASSHDMGVLAYGYFPDELSTPKKAQSQARSPRGLLGRLQPVDEHPLAGMGTYAFLHRTPNWTAEEICLSYVMTEPSISSVLVEATDPAQLTRLAATPDRDMPPGLAAQVEMARFGARGNPAAQTG